MHPDNRNRTYYVVVSRSGDDPNPFCWEIHRRRQAMGVRISDCGHRSHQAAQQAGSKALDKFLDELSKENAAER